MFWIDFRTWGGGGGGGGSPFVTKGNTYGFRGKMCGDMILPYLPCFTRFILLYGSMKFLSSFFPSRHLGLKQCMLNIGEN